MTKNDYANAGWLSLTRDRLAGAKTLADLLAIEQDARDSVPSWVTAATMARFEGAVHLRRNSLGRAATA